MAIDFSKAPKYYLIAFANPVSAPLSLSSEYAIHNPMPILIKDIIDLNVLKFGVPQWGHFSASAATIPPHCLQVIVAIISPPSFWSKIVAHYILKILMIS
jgi:hypothetical protein